MENLLKSRTKMLRRVEDYQAAEELGEFSSDKGQIMDRGSKDRSTTKCTAFAV